MSEERCKIASFHGTLGNKEAACSKKKIESWSISNKICFFIKYIGSFLWQNPKEVKSDVCLRHVKICMAHRKQLLSPK